MKKPITIGVIAVIATILVTSAVDFSADAVKPLMPPQSVACPADKVQHWHTLVMTLSTTIQHDTNPDLTDSRVSIDILAEDGIISNGHLRQQVVDRLNSLGYYVMDPTKRDVQLSDIGSADVEHIRNGSVICAES